MNQLEVNTTNGAYPIYIQKNISDEMMTYIPNVEKYGAFVLITDENVYNIYGEKIEMQLYQTQKRVETIVIPAGDESKSLEIYDQVIETMLESFINRDALIIAFGGGMIGDFAGFVAATYMRGIDFIQVPTTLLAHDSAVGGKVALNHPLAKNVIGAFYQPKAVLYDPELMKTLPDIEWLSGFAEVLKHSEIDADFHLQKMLGIEEMYHTDLYLKEAIEVKRKIIERDPFERGDRIILNYGHTFGHALEQHMHYTLPHGVCVLYGLAFVALLESRNPDYYFQLLSLGAQSKLPLTIADFPSLLSYMKRDKKQKEEGVAFLVKEAQNFAMRAVTEEQLFEAYKQFLEMM